MPCSKNMERVGTVQITIPEALRKWRIWIGTLWFFKKSKARVSSMMIKTKVVDKRIRSVVVSYTLTKTWRTTLTSCQRRKHKARVRKLSRFIRKEVTSRGIWCKGISWSWRMVVWSLLTVLIYLGHVPDDWLSLCWLHGEVDAFDSHVKRVYDQEWRDNVVSQYTGYKPNNVWSDLKYLRAHEHGDSDNGVHAHLPVRRILLWLTSCV